MSAGTPYWSVIVPQAGTNYYPYPSAESISGSAISGSINNGTVARVSGTSVFGAYSIRCRPTQGGESDSGWRGFSQGLAIGSYWFSFYIIGSQGGTVRYGNILTVLGSATMTGTWQRVEQRVGIGDGAVQPFFVQPGVGDPNQMFYIDGIMVGADGATNTTYIDGDQDGCLWLGNAHESASIRDAQSRAGGVELAFTDLRVIIERMRGVGVNGQQTISESFGLRDGGEFQRQRIDLSSFVLEATIIGDSQADLHARRAHLTEVLMPQSVTPASPVRLRYRGSGDDKLVDVDAVFEGGLEYGEQRGFSEEVALAFRVHSARWQAQFDQGTALGVGTGFQLSPLSYRTTDGSWHRAVDGAGTGIYTNTAGTPGTVFDLLRSGENLYVGGTFTSASSLAAIQSAVRWRIPLRQYAAIGVLNSFQGLVLAIARTPDGTVAIGGVGTSYEGTQTDSVVLISRPDAPQGGTLHRTEFGTINSGLTRGTVLSLLALIPDRASGSIALFAGGTFAGIGSSVAELNGSQFRAVGSNGTGITQVVTALGNIAGTAYLGGNFTTQNNQVDLAYIDTTRRIIGAPSGVNSEGARSVAAIGTTLRKQGVIFGSISAVSAGAPISGSTVGAVVQEGVGLYTLGGGVQGEIVDGVILPNGDPVIVGKLSGFDGVPSATGTRAAYATFRGGAWEPGDLLLSSPDTVEAVETGADATLYLGGRLGTIGTVPSLTTLVNTGVAPVAASIRWTNGGTGAVDLVRVENTTTRTVMSFAAYRLQPGEVLIIDGDARTATSSLFGDQSGALAGQGAFDALRLLPGTNVLGVLTTGLGGSLEVSAWWRPNGYGIDRGTA